MPPDLERKLYYQGIHLFNEHEYFDAHEAWEELWHLACGLKHDFYQGLIQAAVALEHYRRSNPRGVISLHRTYPTKFRHLPPVFMGLNIPPFLAAMESTLRPVLTANPLPPRGTIELDPASTPTITLDYDPFDTDEPQRYNSPK